MEADKIDWLAEVEEYDFQTAQNETRAMWLRMGRCLKSVAEAYEDYAGEGLDSANEALAYAARADACLWRAAGDADAIDLGAFIQIKPEPKP